MGGSRLFLDHLDQTKDRGNNVRDTIEEVVATCGPNVNILICGSFYFMADAKRAIEKIQQELLISEEE